MTDPRDGAGPSRLACPEVNALVTVEHADWGAAATSRVEDAATLPDGTTAFVVSAPSLAGSRRARAHPGDELEATWTSERGLHIATTELIAVEAEPLPTWALALRRDPDIVQRRAAYRVAVGRRAEVRRLRDRSRGEAVLTDLSETGARLDDLDGLRVAVGDGIELAMTIDDGPLALPAAVVREHPPPRPHVGVAFHDLPAQEAQRLRRHLITLQLAQRRVRIDE